MTKYARFIDRAAAQDGSDIHTIDVIDMADYNPLPGWYTTDEAFLERIFSPELVAQWKAASQWFIAVPSGVQAGASFSGSDHSSAAGYVNPDGTDGDGNAPQSP